jgi:iron complex outermembrane receptor protein
MKGPKLKLAALASVSFGVMSMGAAVAQSDDSSSSEEVTKRLERVTVTSRKIEESLADAPVSVLAVDGDALTASNITEIEDLALLAPGVTFGESANSRGRGTQIRGIGTSQFGDGVEASVATYVDGVVLGRQAMSINDLIDIERVEVLRGPQGTLFGKNASAGVINIVTKAPDMEKFGLDASISYAEQSEDDAAEVKIGASVTGPIIEDVLAFRLTGTAMIAMATIPTSIPETSSITKRSTAFAVSYSGRQAPIWKFC